MFIATTNMIEMMNSIKMFKRFAFKSWIFNLLDKATILELKSFCLFSSANVALYNSLNLSNEFNINSSFSDKGVFCTCWETGVFELLGVCAL